MAWKNTTFKEPKKHGTFEKTKEGCTIDSMETGGSRHSGRRQVLPHFLDQGSWQWEGRSVGMDLRAFQEVDSTRLDMRDEEESGI